MFSKMTLIFDKSSLIACFGLAFAVSGLALLTQTALTIKKINKKDTFLLIVSIPVITSGLMMILNSEKLTLFLFRYSEYILGIFS